MRMSRLQLLAFTLEREFMELAMDDIGLVEKRFVSWDQFRVWVRGEKQELGEQATDERYGLETPLGLFFFGVFFGTVVETI
jgi:hypothetical protein